MSVINVILTGGVGSRLWPLSRRSQPKQYLQIFNDKSLFELTIERNLKIADKLIIVGNEDNVHLTENAVKKFEVNCLTITETAPRNTAAAIAFAALAAEPEDILVVTPSDHIIEGSEAYKKTMLAAIELAKQNQIVTFGIVPHKPETGYGYIECQGNEVLSFQEKPVHERAQYFISKGNFLWNSGMFCFKAKVILEELKLFCPEIYENATIAWNENTAGKLDYQLSMNIPSLSIDYAVMEQSQKIKVVPATFKWSDLGSFESVYDYLISTGHPIDDNGNMVIGSKVHTEFLGLKETIFVYTETAHLILQKEHSQKVKEIYTKLEQQDSSLLN